MKLKAQKRDLKGKKVKNLRNEGTIPSVVFGPNMASVEAQVNAKEFGKLFQKVGYNKFFDIEIDDSKPVKVLVKDVQVHPVKDFVYSVGFYKINEDRKLNVEVPVEITGVSPVEQNKSGFIVHQLEAIKVHCLPKDLPSNFVVDISKLEKPGDAVTIAEIALPEGVELESSVEPTYAIVYVAAFQKEEEEVPAAVEGEPGAEGATPAEGAAPAEGGEEKKEEK